MMSISKSQPKLADWSKNIERKIGVIDVEYVHVKRKKSLGKYMNVTKLDSKTQNEKVALFGFLYWEGAPGVPCVKVIPRNTPVGSIAIW